MSASRVTTVAFQGLSPVDVSVQVQVASGLPNFLVVGLPDKAIAESRERIRGALNAIGLPLPPKRIIVNLAPADLQKMGSHYDLPIAVGVLASLGLLPALELEEYLILGELSLDGEITPVSGVLPAALHAHLSHRKLICPKSCGPEAAWISDLAILAPGHLLSLINHFKGKQLLPVPTRRPPAPAQKHVDLQDVRGQETAKRALEIAAAGGHNLLMSGPPGAGKSMLAARLPGLLPPLDAQEVLEISSIYSVAGLLKHGQLMHERPFRDPHHSASLPALIGGGVNARPGEISLAHAGVLFLDELPEFPKTVLESLRQPLETGQVLIARANLHVSYPAHIQLIAAMNPCRCGYLYDPGKTCSRAPICGSDYAKKLSGPLLDRLDLRLEMPAVDLKSLINTAPQGESSQTIATRVLQARRLQEQRYLMIPNAGGYARTNAKVSLPILEKTVSITDDAQKYLQNAAIKLSLSARSYHRLLRVARTIADLSAESQVLTPHVAEALSYRQTVGE